MRRRKLDSLKSRFLSASRAVIATLPFLSFASSRTMLTSVLLLFATEARTLATSSFAS